MNHWPWALYPILNPSKKREAVRRWKARKRAEGPCCHCWQRPAGLDGGTRRLCAECRMLNRGRTARSRGKDPHVFETDEQRRKRRDAARKRRLAARIQWEHQVVRMMENANP